MKRVQIVISNSTSVKWHMIVLMLKQQVFHCCSHLLQREDYGPNSLCIMLLYNF